MNDETVDYLQKIGMGDALADRVRTIEKLVLAVLPDEVSLVFVSDYLDDEGNRQYENLYFTTPNYLVEVLGFVSQQTFEIDLIRNNIINLRYESRDYDFKHATEQSRLSIRYTTGPLSAHLKASRENCDYLLRINREAFLPNLVSNQAPNQTAE